MIFFFEKQHNVLFIERFHADLFHEVSSSSMFKNIIRVTEIGCCANVPGYAGCIKGSWEVEWTSGKVLYSWPSSPACWDCCWVPLGWSSGEQKEDLPGGRGCVDLGARGISWTGDSWPLSGCCREAGACHDIHFVGVEQPKGSSTLVFFPISWALPFRALEWELQRPKCELNCLFSWKVLMLFF